MDDRQMDRQMDRQKMNGWMDGLLEDRRRHVGIWEFQEAEHT